MTAIKFCGMTREADLAIAADLGVDAVGFVLWPKSPRAIARDRLPALVKALSPSVTPVAVFVQPTEDDVEFALDNGVRALQIHGIGSQDVLTTIVPTWIGARLEGDGIAPDLPQMIPIVLDAHDPVRHGGTGRTIDWERAARVAATRRVLLAGGLTPANVGDAIRTVRPYGVDVASGIEDRPGVKNAESMRAFVTAVRDADSTAESP
jgi:phosphoribosylanthranilate isomerase